VGRSELRRTLACPRRQGGEGLGGGDSSWGGAKRAVRVDLAGEKKGPWGEKGKG
jgi:hypothetical protein